MKNKVEHYKGASYSKEVWDFPISKRFHIAYIGNFFRIGYSVRNAVLVNKMADQDSHP